MSSELGVVACTDGGKEALSSAPVVGVAVFIGSFTAAVCWFSVAVPEDTVLGTSSVTTCADDSAVAEGTGGVGTLLISKETRSTGTSGGVALSNALAAVCELVDESSAASSFCLPWKKYSIVNLHSSSGKLESTKATYVHQNSHLFHLEKIENYQKVEVNPKILYPLVPNLHMIPPVHDQRYQIQYVVLQEEDDHFYYVF